MDVDKASHIVLEVDARDHQDRVRRLIELDSTLRGSVYLEFSGPAAQWLFDDAKACWLVGAPASTILTAHAFCRLQLMSLVMGFEDDIDRSDSGYTFAGLVDAARAFGAVDAEGATQLLALDEHAKLYSQTQWLAHDVGFERYGLENLQGNGERLLLTDAIDAIAAAVLVASLSH